MSESIHDTVVHEFGHHIHALSFARNPNTKEVDLLGFKEFLGRDPQDRQVDWRNLEAHRALREMIGRKLSANALTNMLETFAESFSWKYAKRRTLPKEWTDFVDRAVERAKKTALRPSERVGQDRALVQGAAARGDVGNGTVAPEALPTSLIPDAL